MSSIDENLDVYQREAQRNEEIVRQQMLREVEFGQAVQKILDGPVGQRILSEAEVELKGLVNTLLDLNLDVLSERDEARVLIARAGILRHWQDAFGKYIIAGQNAEKQLQDEYED